MNGKYSYAGVLEGNYSYIDRLGNTVIFIPDNLEISDVDYSPPEEFQFRDGTAALRAKGGGTYLIDKQGTITFQKEPFRRYDEDGLAIIEVEGKEALVSKDGMSVLSPQGRIICGNEGIYIIEGEDGNYNFVNSSGNLLFKRILEDVGCYHEGLVKVKTNDKWGYLNRLGSKVISCKFEDACDFVGGMSFVRADGKWGLISKNGTFIISPRYDSVMDFNCELAYVQSGNISGYIDKMGRWIWRENKAVE